jgi:hypothetical protein
MIILVMSSIKVRSVWSIFIIKNKPYAIYMQTKERSSFSILLVDDLLILKFNSILEGLNVDGLCFMINYKNNGWITILQTTPQSKPYHLSTRKWSLICQHDPTILSEMSPTSMRGLTNRYRLICTVTDT